MLKNTLFLFSILLFLGCEEKPFSKIYNKQEIGLKIESISLEHKNKKISEKVNNKLKFKIDKNSPYKLQTNYAIYPKKCNNPLATAEQKSYIGFVQFTLFKNGKRIYMCQKDFRKLDEVDEVIESLMSTMIDEMDID